MQMQQVEQALGEGAQKLTHAREQAQQSLAAGKENLAHADAMLRDFMRKNPAMVLFGFLTVGYAVGRWVAKR